MANSSSQIITLQQYLDIVRTTEVDLSDFEHGIVVRLSDSETACQMWFFFIHTCLYGLPGYIQWLKKMKDPVAGSSDILRRHNTSKLKGDELLQQNKPRWMPLQSILHLNINLRIEPELGSYHIS